MAEIDSFTQRSADLLDGWYQCVDRVVLNGYFRLLQSAGGFRTWWRRVQGTDANLDKAPVLRFAGHFGRRVRAGAKSTQVPVVWCTDLPDDAQPHEVAAGYRPSDPQRTGVFCVTVHRAPNSVWSGPPFPNNPHHLERARPCVNHDAFPIQDAEWGQVTIQLCPHPPFHVQVILNGHEFVACAARRQGVPFVPEQNCFVSSPRLADLPQVAETSRSEDATGRLKPVCERWLDSACLCFLMPVEQQQEAGLVCDWSLYQRELSRNLWFQQGRQMEPVFASVIDHTRQVLPARTVTTLCGRKSRPWRQRGPQPRCEVVVERPQYDLTVRKVVCGHRQLKIDTKGDHTLRIEATLHNVRKEFPRVSWIYFPEVLREREAMLTRFLDVLRSVSACWISADTLDRLPEATRCGSTRVAGIDLNRERMRAVLSGVLALATDPRGFRADDLARKVHERLGREYTPRQAAYDLRKLRGKDLVHKLDGTRSYQCPLTAIPTLMAISLVREKILQPLLAGLTSSFIPTAVTNPLDQHYANLQTELQRLMNTLGIAA